MPLSKNEIRKRATAFAHEWRDAHNEDADAKSFWDGFLNVFGVPRKRVAVFEQLVKKLDDRQGYIDLYWPGKLVVEHKSRGKDLAKAHGQAIDYLHGLKDTELPEYIVVSDFARIHLHHLETGAAFELKLAELPKHIDRFDFISGYTSHAPREQDPVNIRAAELMGRLHDELKATGYEGHALEVYLVRMLFILFADDTGIFENNAFADWVYGHTSEDGSDLGPKLERLFQVLNSEKAQRSRNLDERLAEFPYVNGKLFEERLPMADWDGAMRITLLEASQLDWSRISPAIFGALFQSVMDPKARRDLGAHYTSEANILKLIKPLFLDELWEEFNRVKGTAPTTKQRMAKNRVPTPLEKFHKKLSELRFLDPACGCGNFLVITYRELRRLEMEVIRALMKGQQVTNVDQLILLNVDQFYGIEIEDFPAQIAQVALWLTDHQMNQEIGQAFGEYVVRIPLRKSATVLNANALRTDWAAPLPKGKRYDYILGNPPFVGSKLMTAEMRTDLLAAMDNAPNSGILDFVCAWYGLGARYMQLHGQGSTTCAFVSTNSIAQGEQVAALWGPLLAQGIKIHFAHRTFRWNNEARGVAAVHCVIIGFADHDTPKKRLYSYSDPKAEPLVEVVDNINPYLVAGRDVLIPSRSKPICNVPEIVFGSMPNDGGHLIIEDDAKREFLKQEPGAKKFVHRFVGAEEFINGLDRWCLWLKHASPQELKAMPLVLERVTKVKAHRSSSKRGATQKLASTPTLFGEDRQPNSSYIIIPSVSSEKRPYVPIGFMPKDVIASNLCLVVPGAKLFHFGILASAMHNAWMRAVAGRLESRYRYSNKIVYNNFPWPSSPTAAQRAAVEAAAQGVLDARANHPGSSLADLYDPLTMPADLVKAHQALDRAVDKCYRSKPFESESERVGYLFERYEEVVGGVLGGGMANSTRKS
ncbi:MAG: class I SAM-dependent DNA methyltransferase [Flavobacteriales bacterium]|nr:class I SAM-dependent DNA methyltransferase [Flavobacteriales bacterium]